MLDIKYLRDNPDEARRRLATRGRGDEAQIDTLLAQDAKRRDLLVRVEALKATCRPPFGLSPVPIQKKALLSRPNPA